MEIVKNKQPVACTRDQMEYFKKMAEIMSGQPCIAYIRKGKTIIQTARKKKT